MTHRRCAASGRLRLFVIGLCCSVGCGILGTAGWLATSTASNRGGSGPVVNRGQLPDATGVAPRAVPHILGKSSADVLVPRDRPLAAGSRLQVPGLGVDAVIIAVTAPDGVMRVPPDPGVLGWWAGGSGPGAGRGHVVIVGHINYHGQQGALAALSDLHPGDAATVRGPSATVRYIVRAVRSYPKSAGLPSQVFTGSGPEELVLITCGGALDTSTGNYADNIVAYATPAG